MAGEDKVISLNAGVPTVISVEENVKRFVFQPSGTASNGVYTSWSDLYTDLAASTAPVREVILDDSALGAYPDPVVIPSGTYDFSGVKIVGRPSERASISGFLEIELANGATIENCAGIKNIVLINHGGAGPTPPAKGSGTFSFDSGLTFQYFEIDRCFLGSLSDNTIINISNSTFLVALLKNRSSISPNSTAITVENGSSLDFRLIGGSTINDDCIADTLSGGTLSYSYVDAGSKYNVSQTNFGGTKPTEVESSNTVQYSPANPGDWSSPPNNVMDALNFLAAGAIVAGGIGGSTGGTDNAVLRADGVGGSTLQSTGVIIDDSNNLTLPGTAIVNGTTSAGYDAALEIQGTDASVSDNAILSLAGTDGYPGMFAYHYQHDDIGIYFDAYFTNSGVFSSDAGSNACIYKFNDELAFGYKSGITAGSSLTFDTALKIDLTSGEITANEFAYLNGGRKLTYTSPITKPYSLSYGTNILGIDTVTLGATTVNLPDPTAEPLRYAGYTVIIKDEAGNSATDPITINATHAVGAGASSTIDGSTSITISTNYASVTLYSDGANWFIV